MLQALLASGMPEWEAIGTVAGQVGADAVRDRWERFLSGSLDEKRVLDALDQVAAGSPETANAFLNVHLASVIVPVHHELDLSDRPWITNLPFGLSVGGQLNLSGCVGLEALPSGLKVGSRLKLNGCGGLKTLPEDLSVASSLDLSDCTGLTKLPKGLKVGGYLDLSGCLGLKRIPEGLDVRNHLFCPGRDLRDHATGMRGEGRIRIGGSIW
jgi:hypothetical protein